ncbi:MAG: hypothetical protein ACRBBR_00705 [Cellvibrionaceae bacterium]
MINSKLVGHADCPECGERSEVRENKRKKLLLDCPVHSTFLYQSKRGQVDLRKRTEFLVSEDTTEAVASPEIETVKSEPVAEVVDIPKKSEPVSEPVQKKSKKWSLYK